MIGKSGERGSGISVLAARHDDDYDDNKALPLKFGQLYINSLPLGNVKCCKIFDSSFFFFNDIPM